MFKTIIIIVALMAAAAAALYASASQQKKERRDDEGHVLESMWKEYKEAERGDKPQMAGKVLAGIKSEASSRHLPWDFYDASQKYVEVMSRRDWKCRDSLDKAFSAEVDAFDEPVVTYARMVSRNRRDDLSKFVSASEKRLAGARNDQFYNLRYIKGKCYGELIQNSLRNDLEFVLWDMVGSMRDASGDEAYELLQKRLDGRYPESALLEYDRIKDTGGYEKFAEKYTGRGVSFIALQELLDRRLSDLHSKHSDQDGYVALRRECTELISRMKELKGEEKRIASCCDYAEEIVKTLDAGSVSASVNDGVLAVVFQNLSSAVLTISSKEGKEIYRSQVRDAVRRYFVKDTVNVDLPAFDDGEYVLEAVSGKYNFKCDYHKYTISLASRSDAEAFRIYAADYKTGRPVDKASLILMSSGKELVRCDGFVFDGFTGVPEEFVRMSGGGKYSELFCEYRDADGILHKSQCCTNREKTAAYEGVDVQSAVILCDRSAFKPGETMHFKGILFHGDRYTDLEPVDEGVSVKAVLVNPDGKDVDSMDLYANEFGSVAGSFDIPEEGKNGLFMIELRQGRTTLHGEFVSVDDFVLPSFVINFDEDKSLYLPGDKVHFRGKVESFSGHSVSGASAEATVDCYGRTPVLNKTLELAPDGSFDIEFDSDSLKGYANYRCEVKVVDSTGETIRANASAAVTDGLNLRMDLENKCEGDSSLPETSGGSSVLLLGDNVARVRFNIGDRDGTEIKYELLKEGRSLGTGSAEPGEVKDIVLPDPSGLYTVRAVVTAVKACGERIEESETMEILAVSDSEGVLDAPVENMFRKVEGEDVAFVMGAASGEVWAVVELFDQNTRLLVSDKIHLDGRRGEAGSLKTLRYAFDPAWGDVVSLGVLYFRNGIAYRFNASYENKRPVKSIPLEFDRVVDVSQPGATCVVTMKTEADVECVATVFDKSTEMIHSNSWLPVRLWQRWGGIWYSTENGCDRSEVPVRIRGKAMAVSSAANSARVLSDNLDIVDDEISVTAQEEAIPFQMAEAKPAFGGATEVQVRENFASTVAFEPFLRSGDDGNIEFSFKTGDKLSTFVVQAFAHDRQFNNEVIRREMKVTLPVKMAVVEPQFLYRGDKYVLKATVSSNSDAPVVGGVELEAFDGASWKDAVPFLSRGVQVTVPAGGSVPVECEIAVPDLDTLGVKLTFRTADASTSDAVFVTIPVWAPAQTLTEAHSALLSAGMDRDKLISDLRGLFVNAPGTEASVTEISILDMVKDAVPELVRTDRRDLVSVSDAMYSGLLARSLKADVAVPVSELERKLLLCRCDCGGFSWFEGMDPSPILTALVLERYHALSRKGLAGEVRTLGAMVPDAVRYLDKSFFADGSLPLWRGAMSLQQYLYIRSLYPDVGFDPSSAKSGVLKKFRKEAKEYLIPRKERGLDGMILLKARRCLTLMHLTEEGSPLLSSWGISLGKMPAIRRSCLADVESLLEYAVPHKSGGYYYPNAVMPWRGLMESELYAHVILCDLLDDVPASGADAALSMRSSGIAEGIRLWIMVQKETQQWGSDPAFVDALAAVLGGRDETLATKVVVLKAGFTKPFDDIAASGNGFAVSRSYKRDGKLLKDGDTLRVGDRIMAEYSIKNDENRSFVLLSCPRPASMRPVQQLSGRIGWGLWRGSQGYRNVLRGRSEYWYDSYPEENTTVTEELFVTQKGVFRTPAVSIESLYAPHYRANDSGRGPVVSE